MQHELDERSRNDQNTTSGVVMQEDVKILELGRSYMEEAEQNEMDSDYIAAEGIYHVCCDMFRGMMDRASNYQLEAKGEYMHSLFRCAMLPQIDSEEKQQYLDDACALARELLAETGEQEYSIAVDCMQEELDEVTKNLKEKMLQRQEEIILF